MAYGKAGHYGPEALLSKVAAGLVQDSLLPVNVYLPGTTTLAALWTSAAKTASAANPVSTDSNGNLAFYADPGYYDLNFTPVGGSATTISNVLVPLDPSDTTPGTLGSGTYLAQGGPFVSVTDTAYGAKGDGITDDTTAIQAAISNAAAGAELVLPVGTYLTSSTLTVSRKISFRAAPGVVIKRASGSTGAVLSFVAGSDGSTFQGGTIDASLAATAAGSGVSVNSAADVTIRGVTVTSAKGYGIYGQRSDRITIDGCTVLNSTSIGIFVETSASATANVLRPRINNNTVDRTGIAAASITEGGIKVHGNGGATPYSVIAPLITGNTVLLPPSPTDISCVSIEATYSRNARVSGNTTSGGTMGTSVAASDKSSVTGNTFSAMSNYGIELAGSKSCSVTGNTIDGASLTSAGIMLDQGNSTNSDRASVTGNAILNCVNNAINIQTAADCVVTGNTCIGGAASTYIVNASQADGLTFTGNTLDGLTVAQKCLFLNTTSRVVVTGNTFRNVTQNAVTLYAASAYTINLVVVTGNLADGTAGIVQTQVSGGAAVGAYVRLFGNLGQADYFDLNGGITFQQGTGSPNNSVYGAVGSVWLQTDGAAGKTIWSKTSGAANTNTGWQTLQNQGIGPQTAPGMSASGTALVNPFAFPVTVYVSGGTVSAVSVSATATGLTSGAFRVPAGGSITLTYTVAPSWAWVAD